MLLDLITTGRSFTYRPKIMEPKMEPFGTPLVDVSGPDNDVALRVRCCLLVR